MKRIIRTSRIPVVPSSVQLDEPATNPVLEDLKQEFEFKWRVSNTNKFSKKSSCVAYADSRQVQDVFDNVCGQGGWQDKYQDVGGNTYCHIGIKIDGEWIWKSDCGSESNIEKEKGQASDAFKRAAIKWGVGRFLYSMRNYQLPAQEISRGGKSQWVPVDDKGNEIPPWAITAYINGKRGTSKPVPAADPTAKQSDASSELETLEKWVSGGILTKHILIALEWLNHKLSEKDYKREGLGALPRAEYSHFCHLVAVARFDIDLVDMALEGLGFKSIADGGIADAVKKEQTEKLSDECKLIHKQENESSL